MSTDARESIVVDDQNTNADVAQLTEHEVAQTVVAVQQVVVQTSEHLVEVQLATIKELAAQVSKVTGDVTLNATTLMQIVKTSMEVVEGFTVMRGAQKKELVVNIVRYLVEQAPPSPEQQLGLTLIYSGVVDSAIELVVSAAKGKVHINLLPTHSRGCACTIS